MTPTDAHSGSRTVEPRKRKRHRSPSDKAREARRLVERIEAETAARHQAWQEGAQPNLTSHGERELDRLHHDKREMRREVYRALPVLEGTPTNRPAPRSGG